METTFRSTAPARICLAGEDLDWMAGPALLATLNVRLSVVISPPSVGDRTKLDIEVLSPFRAQGRYLPSNLRDYDGGVLDYVRASIVTLADDAGVTIPPLAVSVTSDIPAGAGLSSSAAVVLATLAAFARHMGRDYTRAELCDLAYRVEAQALGTGAGQMDFYACALGGFTYVHCDKRPPEPLESYPKPTRARVLLIDTRQSRSTRDVIAWKRRRRAAREEGILRYEEVATENVRQLRALLRQDHGTGAELAPFINRCHQSMVNDLRVSTPLIDACIDACLSGGALAAKITGTGLGGCLFALVDFVRVPAVRAALNRLAVDVTECMFDDRGLHTEPV
jgi:galactokinase